MSNYVLIDKDGELMMELPLIPTSIKHADTATLKGRIIYHSGGCMIFDTKQQSKDYFMILKKGLMIFDSEVI